MNAEIPLEGARYCDFEWLDYFAQGQTSEERLALAQQRAELAADDELKAIMKGIGEISRSRSKQ
jgi:hypothetical protein